MTQRATSGARVNVPRRKVKSTKLLAGLLIVSALLFARSAYGQPAVPGLDPSRDAARPTEVEEPEFRVLDKDGDAFLSREESAAAPDVAKRFEIVDRNKDGKLDREEFEAALKPDSTGNTGAARGGSGA